LFDESFFCSLQMMVHRTGPAGFPAFPAQLHYDNPAFSSSLPRTPKQRRQLDDADIIRRILLYKGKEVSPRDVVMNVNGRWKAEAITGIMLDLQKKGAGTFFSRHRNHKGSFNKRPAEEILELLDEYKINVESYRQRYEYVRPIVDTGIIVSKQDEGSESTGVITYVHRPKNLVSIKQLQPTGRSILPKNYVVPSST
jgi:hypothetical protein